VVTKVFLDSNVLVYAAGPTSAKADRARALLANGPTISVQVLNEFVNVTRKKLKQDWTVVDEGLSAANDLCDIVDLTVPMQARALEIAKTHSIPIYDANIVSAAELSGCDVLYTEDMHHGQRIGRVLIQNPFRAA
jgi:predicted nucleic acid-binding protein